MTIGAILIRLLAFNAVCPRSSYLFYIVSYFIKWMTMLFKKTVKIYRLRISKNSLKFGLDDGVWEAGRGDVSLSLVF